MQSRGDKRLQNKGVTPARDWEVPSLEVGKIRPVGRNCLSPTPCCVVQGKELPKVCPPLFRLAIAKHPSCKKPSPGVPVTSSPSPPPPYAHHTHRLAPVLCAPRVFFFFSHWSEWLMFVALKGPWMAYSVCLSRLSNQTARFLRISCSFSFVSFHWSSGKVFCLCFLLTNKHLLPPSRPLS